MRVVIAISTSRSIIIERKWFTGECVIFKDRVKLVENHEDGEFVGRVVVGELVGRGVHGQAELAAHDLEHLANVLDRRCFI